MREFDFQVSKRERETIVQGKFFDKKVATRGCRAVIGGAESFQERAFSAKHGEEGPAADDLRRGPQSAADHAKAIIQ